MASPTAATAATAAVLPIVEPLTMFIVVRRDLLKPPNSWPLAAALWTFKDHPSTLAYTAPANLASMTKVVYQLKNESQLQALAARLDERGLDHVVWREQPENVLTALATRPYRRSEVGDAFKKCSLFG
ncbi:peptidyl-tRNA hydrolase II domain-containing protein [Catenaria anguillulae PL171]|uniref:peptidyl-tRNA hydrolase n=1 Tax=Catenaria anguillulae PL171 TaxID=765915 RepID=A0A1Y2HWR2_9FUNG|nr:peptidyl-tRNA hydrolase II domain-containing protein [Catenaria anguillulae PL171]